MSWGTIHLRVPGVDPYRGVGCGKSHVDAHVTGNDLERVTCRQCRRSRAFQYHQKFDELISLRLSEEMFQWNADRIFAAYDSGAPFPEFWQLNLPVLHEQREVA